MTFPRFFLFLVAIASTAMISSSRADAETNGFSIPRERILAEVHKIGLEPIRLPEETPNAEAVGARVEAIVASELASNGFTVVPSSEFRRIWLENAKALGGIYDRSNGASDDQKWNACFEHTARELGRQQGVDATVSLKIFLDLIEGGFQPSASGFFGEAYAAGEPIMIQGKLLTTSGNEQIQRIDGLWLGFALRDASKTNLFSLKSAIEWRRIYWRRRFEERVEPALTNDDAIRAAVARLVKRLARGE
jgi:hypothetical protein